MRLILCIFLEWILCCKYHTTQFRVNEIQPYLKIQEFDQIELTFSVRLLTIAVLFKQNSFCTAGDTERENAFVCFEITVTG